MVGALTSPGAGDVHCSLGTLQLLRAIHGPSFHQARRLRRATRGNIRFAEQPRSRGFSSAALAIVSPKSVRMRLKPNGKPVNEAQSRLCFLRRRSPGVNAGANRGRKGHEWP
jgi:hypothetical protein